MSKNVRTSSGALVRKAAEETVVEFLDKYMEIQVHGPGRFKSKPIAVLSLAELQSEFYDWLQSEDEVTKNLTPKFWFSYLDKELKRRYKAKLNQISMELAYKSPLKSQSEALLLAYVQAVTGKTEQTDCVALKHFLWLIKRKLMQLKVSYHLMPIFWGVVQGSGKTTSIRKLLQPMAGGRDSEDQPFVYSGLSFDKIGDDRYYNLFEQYPVIFVDEMPKIDKADIETIKGAITSETLTARMLHTHQYNSYTNNAVFIGATNNTPSSLIKDTSGMRRFYYIAAQQKLDWETINNLEYTILWQGINEHADPPILELKEEIALKQEETRERDAIELFIEEGWITKQLSSPEASTFKSSDAYELYKVFCEDNGYKYTQTKHAFNKELENKHGFMRVMSASLNKRSVSFYGVTASRGSMQHGKEGGQTSAVVKPPATH